MDSKLCEDLFRKIIEEANEKQTKQIQETIDHIKNDITEIKATLSQEISKRKEVEEKYNDLQIQYRTLDKQTRKNNIILFGLHYKKPKNNSQDKKKLLEFCLAELNQYLSVQIDYSDVNDIYTLGHQEDNSPILLKFCSFIKKQQILKNCKTLKGSSIAISEDLTPEERKVNKCLYMHLKEARQDNKSAYIKGDKLFIDNKPYTVNDFQNKFNNKGNKIIDNLEEDAEEEEDRAEGTATGKGETSKDSKNNFENDHKIEGSKEAKPIERRLRNTTRKKL